MNSAIVQISLERQVQRCHERLVRLTPPPHTKKTWRRRRRALVRIIFPFMQWFFFPSAFFLPFLMKNIFGFFCFSSSDSLEKRLALLSPRSEKRFSSYSLWCVRGKKRKVLSLRLTVSSTETFNETWGTASFQARHFRWRFEQIKRRQNLTSR